MDKSLDRHVATNQIKKEQVLTASASAETTASSSCLALSSASLSSLLLRASSSSRLRISSSSCRRILSSCSCLSCSSLSFLSLSSRSRRSCSILRRLPSRSSYWRRTRCKISFNSLTSLASFLLSNSPLLVSGYLATRTDVVALIPNSKSSFHSRNFTVQR